MQSGFSSFIYFADSTFAASDVGNLLKSMSHFGLPSQDPNLPQSSAKGKRSNWNALSREDSEVRLRQKDQILGGQERRGPENVA
jgi:hypothetical protein